MSKELVTYTEAQKALGKEVNDAYSKANESARAAVKEYLIVGSLLQEMRDLMPGDKEFGRWRSDNTSISKVWANKLMRASKTYGLAPPVSLPISTLAELSYIEDDKRKELEAQAADPEQKTPSVRDVKKVAKEEKAKPVHIDLDAPKPGPAPAVKDEDTTEYIMVTLTAEQINVITCDLIECGHDELANQIMEDYNE